MKIVISGGTGFLGHYLTKYLNTLGHDLILIQRSDWSEGADRISKLINSADVLINLTGSPVIKRWTVANKINILESRLKTLNLLIEIIMKMNSDDRPKVILSASAIGIYDSVHVHNEISLDFADNFLANVCQQWEERLKLLVNANVRICILRIGIVLGREGGMLKQLISLFNFGLGGRIGSGKQGFSFIHHQDFCRAVEFLILHEQCRGIFNLTAPDYSTNSYFTKVLARACHRPAFFIVPEFALKLIYGKAAIAMISGQFVLPGHLLECGFKFQYPDIESAIRAIMAE